MHEVGSADVNDYLRAATGADFTAKDYRTWGGSAHALHRLAALRFESATEAKRHVVATIREAAQRLGNTPAVCRKCYVHPAIVEHYLAGALHALPRARGCRGLKPEEAVLLAFLRRLARASAQPGSVGAARRVPRRDRPRVGRSAPPREPRPLAAATPG